MNINNFNRRLDDIERQRKPEPIQIRVYYEDEQTGKRTLYQILAMDSDGQPVKAIPAHLWDSL